jgi:CcmD family protein
MNSIMETMGRTVGQRVAADFVVMAVALLVWVGIFIYLFRLDRKVKALIRKEKGT